MKKFLILLVAICCSGCEVSTRKPVMEYDTFELSSTTSVQYIEFDGHQFIRYYCGGVHGGGSLCHSPNCPCLEQYKTK